MIASTRQNDTDLEGRIMGVARFSNPDDLGRVVTTVAHDGSACSCGDKGASAVNVSFPGSAYPTRWFPFCLHGQIGDTVFVPRAML